MALINDAKKRCKTPIKISWKNVCFEVTVKTTAEEIAATGKTTKRQMVVNHVTGVALPGQTTFIMGASGAGKTSMLNILSDRVKMINQATLSGDIVFNDEIPVNLQTFARYASYVMQDDILFSRFTVKEALTFTARLKLKCEVEEQDARVDEIIKDLGLGYC
jgi:ABC-type multidrug transport system ATPase subunit